MRRQHRLLAIRSFWLALTLGLGLSAGTLWAAPQVGKPAPAFSGVDTSGRSWTLQGLRGKRVILEWTNNECPYVRKHYGSGNMQALQRDASKAGYVWLSVISSAPGRQGHVTPGEAEQLTQNRGAAPTAVLLDETGEIGRAYGAKTTPHMFIIGADGTLLYMGGIDDRPTTDPADIKGAENYVRAAMGDIAAGRPVAQPVTRPYGCSVKY